MLLLSGALDGFTFKVKLLNEKSNVPLPYPYEMVERMNKFNQRK